MSTFKGLKKQALGAALGAGCERIRRPGPQRTGRNLGPIVARDGPSGDGDRIERWHSSGRARARPAAAVSSGRSQRELRQSSAVSSGLPRQAGLGSVIVAPFGLVIAGAGAAPLAGLLLLAAVGSVFTPAAGSRSPVAAASVLGGRRPASAHAAWGGGLAAAAFAAVAGWGRHRLGGDLPNRNCGRDRDEDQDVRPVPSRSGARAGGLAVTTPAKVGRDGALGVMCLVRARGIERVEHDVLVVSIDRLTLVLRVAAGVRSQPPSLG